jgi:uncharacterized protein (TIGR02452 family)
MFRTNLSEVYADTQRKCRTGKFSTLEKCVSYMYSADSPEISGLTMTPKFKTNVQVVNGLVLEVTQKLVTEGNTNIMVLNLASSYNPGGGVVKGAVAQEEDLFRKTNYFLCLPRKFYPIPKSNVIYTEKVFVVKNTDFSDLKSPFPVSMLAAAAIKNPTIIGGRYTQPDYNVMKSTIDNIFKVAYLHGKETLVLGALGCGAYRNPPNIVISIFNDCLRRYDGCFKNIVFAVYSTRDDNFDLFDKHIHRP